MLPIAKIRVLAERRSQDNFRCDKMTKLIFGCGYLGERVATRWWPQATMSLLSPAAKDRAERFSKRGFAPIVADVTRTRNAARFACRPRPYCLPSGSTAGL